MNRSETHARILHLSSLIVATVGRDVAKRGVVYAQVMSEPGARSLFAEVVDLLIKSDVLAEMPHAGLALTAKGTALLASMEQIVVAA